MIVQVRQYWGKYVPRSTETALLYWPSLRGCSVVATTSLHRNRRSPGGAIHLHARLGPLTCENSTVGSSLLADLIHWFTVVQIELGWERILLAAALPSVAEPREGTWIVKCSKVVLASDHTRAECNGIQGWRSSNGHELTSN